MPRPWGSHRLPRRNHYQEGPDFLFVATEGGRPPGAGRRAGIASVVRRRRRALRRLEVGEPASAICAEVGCSRASLYRWRERYRAGGLAGLTDAPRRGRASEPLELMSDNGTPFVAIVRSMLSRFERTLEELAIRHIRTQIDTPWINGKIEAFWRILQAEVLDRQRLEDVMAAEAAVQAYAGYYNLHRLHGSLGWRTPAERFDGTPFLDRDLDHIPLLTGAAPLLNELIPVLL